LLIIVIALAGLFFGEEAAKGQIVEQIQGLVGRDGAQFIQTAIGIFNCEVAPKPKRSIWGFIRKSFLSFTMILGIGFLLLVSLVMSAALAAFANFISGLLPSVLLRRILNLVISFRVITLLFAMIYKFLLDVKITWGDVWIGAAITVMLFTLGKYLIGLYLGQVPLGFSLMQSLPATQLTQSAN